MRYDFFGCEIVSLVLGFNGFNGCGGTKTIRKRADTFSREASCLLVRSFVRFSFSYQLSFLSTHAGSSSLSTCSGPPHRDGLSLLNFHGASFLCETAAPW